MRWFVLAPMLISLGCSLFGGGITGAWSSSNGLSVEIQQDRSWKGSYPTSLGSMEMSGQWNLEDGKLTLIPSNWKPRTAFPGVKLNRHDADTVRRDANRIVDLMREKRFVLTTDGEYDILKDVSHSGAQTMYRVQE